MKITKNTWPKRQTFPKLLKICKTYKKVKKIEQRKYKKLYLFKIKKTRRVL